MLKKWLDKLQDQRANYDEILHYASNHIYLNSLGEEFCATLLIYNLQDLDQAKCTLLENFENLNILLLKYIPNQPDAKWCTLPSLLQEYGIAFPHVLQERLSKHIHFPGQDKSLDWEPLLNPLPPSMNGRFQPGHEVSIQLSKDCSLCDLCELVTLLQKFEQPVLSYLEMLVFFKLRKSVMFDKYLKDQLRHLRLESEDSTAASTGKSSIHNFSPSYSSPKPVQYEESREESLQMKVFIQSLRNTKELLSKVMKGNAEYYEITARGQLQLENLKIDEEFAVLSEFSKFHPLISCTGLSDVKTMLELFQYSNYIHNIQEVCTQYKIQGCLDDPKLTELMVLVGELGSENARAKLTPIEASQRMQVVKENLSFTEKNASICLDLFPVVRDSADFYQFIRDKQFYGENGKAIFYQQYQLITAQLQHEEYDEQVLNHLFAAFKLMTPFLDSSQDMGSLMSKVQKLDITNGQMQLETVNKNISLIRLWFLRAEVS